MRLWKNSIVDKKALLLYLTVLGLTVFSKELPLQIPAAILVIASGVFGIIFGKESKLAQEVGDDE